VIFILLSIDIHNVGKYNKVFMIFESNKHISQTKNGEVV